MEHMEYVLFFFQGLTADGRGLTNFMRTETLNHEIVYGSDMPMSRLIATLGNIYNYKGLPYRY